MFVTVAPSPFLAPAFPPCLIVALYSQHRSNNISTKTSFTIGEHTSANVMPMHGRLLLHRNVMCHSSRVCVYGVVTSGFQQGTLHVSAPRTRPLPHTAHVQAGRPQQQHQLVFGCTHQIQVEENPLTEVTVAQSKVRTRKGRSRWILLTVSKLTVLNMQGRSFQCYIIIEYHILLLDMYFTGVWKSLGPLLDLLLLAML